MKTITIWGCGPIGVLHKYESDEIPTINDTLVFYCLKYDCQIICTVYKRKLYIPIAGESEQWMLTVDNYNDEFLEVYQRVEKRTEVVNGSGYYCYE